MNARRRELYIINRERVLKQHRDRYHKNIDENRRKQKKHNKKYYAKYRHIRLDVALKNKEQLAGRNKPTKCDICPRIDIICYDHDHKTGKFRGWICTKCNKALGLAADNPDILRGMALYLEEFNERIKIGVETLTKKRVLQ